MEKGVPTEPRGGTHRDRESNVPTRGTNDTPSRTLDRTYAFNMHFLIRIYFRQLRVSCVLM